MTAPFPSFTKTWHTTTYSAITPSNPLLSQADKTIIITGGASGIGGAIATSFAQAGAPRIALLGRRSPVLEAKKAELLALAPNLQVLTIPSDISNAKDITTALARIVAIFGAPDILINNAAYFAGATPTLEEDVDSWFRSFETNAKGTFLLTQAFMKAAGPQPTILNVSTAITHLSPSYFPGFSAYAASKAASTIYLSYVQTENPHVHIVHMHPGQIVTDMAEKVGMTTPIDLVELPADFAVWVVSPEAKFLKGKFVWANWDVEELKASSKDIEDDKGLLTFDLEGAARY